MVTSFVGGRVREREGKGGWRGGGEVEREEGTEGKRRKATSGGAERGGSGHFGGQREGLWASKLSS